jgi:hypothetical protein
VVAAQDVGKHDRRNDLDASPAGIIEDLGATSDVDGHAGLCR